MTKREEVAKRRAHDRSRANRAREKKLYNSPVYRKARKLGITVTKLRKQLAASAA